MTDEDLPELRFTAREYGTLLNWFMASDPWPTTQLENDRMKTMLDEEAQRRGWDSWVEAYHEMHMEEA